MAQIFISYSRADRQFVDEVVPIIRKVYRRDNLWFDDEIHGGVDWWQTILRQIAGCDLFIYLISNESLESPYCQAEFQEALRLRKQILPIIVRRLNPPYPGKIAPALVEELKRTQYIDMIRGVKDVSVVTELMASINRLLENVHTLTSVPWNSTPTPRPLVPDKKRDSTIVAAYIGGVFVLVTGVIAGIFSLWEGKFANNDITPSIQVTNVAQADLLPTSPSLVAFIDSSSENMTNFVTEADEPFMATLNSLMVTASQASHETAEYALQVQAIGDTQLPPSTITLESPSITQTEIDTEKLPDDTNMSENAGSLIKNFIGLVIFSIIVIFIIVAFNIEKILKYNANAKTNTPTSRFGSLSSRFNSPNTRASDSSQSLSRFSSGTRFSTKSENDKPSSPFGVNRFGSTDKGASDPSSQSSSRFGSKPENNKPSSTSSRFGRFGNSQPTDASSSDDKPNSTSSPFGVNRFGSTDKGASDPSSQSSSRFGSKPENNKPSSTSSRFGRFGSTDKGASDTSSQSSSRFGSKPENDKPSSTSSRFGRFGSTDKGPSDPSSQSSSRFGSKPENDEKPTSPFGRFSSSRFSSEPESSDDDGWEEEEDDDEY